MRLFATALAALILAGSTSCKDRAPEIPVGRSSPVIEDKKSDGRKLSYSHPDADLSAAAGMPSQAGSGGGLIPNGPPVSNAPHSPPSDWSSGGEGSAKADEMLKDGLKAGRSPDFSINGVEIEVINLEFNSFPGCPSDGAANQLGGKVLTSSTRQKTSDGKYWFDYFKDLQKGDYAAKFCQITRDTSNQYSDDPDGCTCLTAMPN